MFEPKKGLKKPNWKKLTPNKVQENSIWTQVQTDEAVVSDDLIDSLVENFASASAAAGGAFGGKGGAGGGPGDRNSVANGAGNGKASGAASSKKVIKCRVLSDKTAQSLGTVVQ